MFVTPRVKRVGAPSTKKRKVSSAIEEITFDSNARQDYLTGFHKRKLKRIQHAKEEAARKERQEKISARKTLRDGRKAELEERIEAMNSALRQQSDAVSDTSEDTNTQRAEVWDGIADEDTVDHDDEYSDDDRFTTVTVKAVNVSKEGMHNARQSDGDETDETDVSISPAEDPGALVRREQMKPRNKKRVWMKDPPNEAKKKRKKFRYESKAERKVTRIKERSGNRAKAKARKH